MKLRHPKDSDQELSERAFELLLDFLESYQHEIEPSLWVGPMIGALAANFEKSEVPFEIFRRGMIEGIDHYKY